MNRIREYILLFLLALSILLAIFLYIMNGKVETQKRVFENFKNQSARLISLKKRWRGDKDYKKIFSRLRAISKPIKDEMVGDRHVFGFSDLSSTSMRSIVSVLFNSGFIIKKLDIQKKGKKIALHVEVKL